jgi:putative methionine-R-sulfoxide reductase with GAF domain
MLAKRLGGEEAARSWVRALAERVAAAKDAEDAMREIAEGLSKDVDPYAFGVFLEDPGAHALVLHHRLAHGPLKGVPIAVHPEQGLVGFVFRHGVPLVVHDVAGDPRYIRGPLADSMTALAVPIKAGRETVGAVDIESDEAWTFDACDVEGIQDLASALGSVVARTRGTPSRSTP